MFSRLAYVLVLTVASVILPFCVQAQTLPALNGATSSESLVDAYVTGVREQYPAYKFISDVQDLPDRNGTLENFYVGTIPINAVLALHDAVSGQPLDSCLSPCDLKVRPGEPYWIVAYKFGHDPVWTYLDTSNPAASRNISLGLNWFEVMGRKQQCLLEWDSGDKRDGEAEVCFRIPPPMPPAAQRSGHCRMLFDVDATGQPVNIATTHCSDEVFKDASLATVQIWHYTPKTDRGSAVVQRNIETKLTYRLSDESGNLIPE